MRRSELILNKKQGNPEMKASTMMSSNMYSSRAKNPRDSLRNRRSMMGGKRKFESSGTECVIQMSQKIDKLIGRSIHKKNFKKRFETTVY